MYSSFFFSISSTGQGVYNTNQMSQTLKLLLFIWQVKFVTDQVHLHILILFFKLKLFNISQLKVTALTEIHVEAIPDLPFEDD